jgi:hypothetical protein
MITHALEALDEVLHLLTDPVSGCAIEPPPCRVSLYPGIEVAWDTCEVNAAGDNGQLWANLLGTPTITDEGPCQTVQWAGEIGIVRCAAGPRESSSGEYIPPSVEAVTADALRQAQDADAIWRALACCESRSERVRGMVLTSWRPVGPQGGCVGGIWTVRGAFSVCC